MKRYVVGMVALTSVAGACAMEAPAADPSVLLEADRAFDAAVAEGGSAAWASWFAEDGAVIQEGVGEIRGRTAVGEASAFLDAEGVSLRWEPTRAEIAASGDLGWTTGTWVSARDGVEAGRGVYVTIWRLEEDGSWKAVMDLGASTGEGG